MKKSSQHSGCKNMSIAAVCGLSIIAVVFSLLIMDKSPIFSLLIIIAAGVSILIFVLGDIKYLLGEIQSIVSETGIDNRYYTIALKSLGICYLTQFTSEICRDFGQSSVASKIELVGKVLIVTLTLPLIKGIINIATELLK